jgi:hypothetical protein
MADMGKRKRENFTAGRVTDLTCPAEESIARKEKIMIDETNHHPKSELGTDDDLTPEELAIRMRGVKRIEYYAVCDTLLPTGGRCIGYRLAGPFLRADDAREAAKHVQLPPDAITGIDLAEHRRFR